MSLFSDKKDCWAQIPDMLIDEDPLGEVKFVQLFKVTVISLHAIMMKPEIKLILFRNQNLLELICLSYPS